MPKILGSHDVLYQLFPFLWQIHNLFHFSQFWHIFSHRFRRFHLPRIFSRYCSNPVAAGKKKERKFPLQSRLLWTGIYERQLLYLTSYCRIPIHIIKFLRNQQTIKMASAFKICLDFVKRGINAPWLSCNGEVEMINFHFWQKTLTFTF